MDAVDLQSTDYDVVCSTSRPPMENRVHPVPIESWAQLTVLPAGLPFIHIASDPLRSVGGRIIGTR
jgi:hypothetical protein